MPEVLLRKQQYDQVLDILDGLGCGLLSTDDEGKIGYANERLASWLGYDKDELITMQDADLVPPELREIFLADVRQGEPDLRVRLLAIQRKDSTTFPVLAIPQHYYDEHGEIDRWVMIIVDLGAVQTAKHIGYRGPNNLRSTLQRIALELESASLMTEMAPPATIRLDHPDLAEASTREREVLMLLVVGDRVPGIAKQLHISPHTVRNHLKALYRKLGVNTQAELIERVRALKTPD
jgi:PAS domain S-box-containing protein